MRCCNIFWNCLTLYLILGSYQRHWVVVYSSPWWRHQMEIFSALLAFSAGNSPVPGEFPAQRPATRSFDVFFGLRLNKRLRKQSWGWWFETLSCSLWRHCNALHKQGSNCDVENFRGITLLSILGKLFTRILNNRIQTWAEDYGIYIEAQNGFRPGRGTTDSIFILHCLINIFLETNKHCILYL